MPDSPSQEIYSAVLVALRQEWPSSVFDGFLPAENTPYPFIHLGEVMQSSDQRTKQAVFGSVTLTIHVWHSDLGKRGDLDRMIFKAEEICRKITDTSSYKWRVGSSSVQILPDTTTRTPLLHGILNIEFQHYWR